MSAPTARSSRAATGALLFVLAAAGTGCASRAAPFDNLDRAQVTILKVQAAQAQTPPPAPGGVGGIAIPGLPPELQGLATQTLQQMQAQGLLPPGLQIPGLTGTNPAVPPQPQFPPYPNDPQWAIADQRPVVDERLKEELLDLFGIEDNFNNQPGQCYYPGMIVSFQDPSMAPVDVAVSLSCNQAVGYGFQWPHSMNGLTQETHQRLTQIYQSMFGPVPPGA